MWEHWLEVNNEKTDMSKPPINILVNPSEINTNKPWDVDIQEILGIFIKLIEKMDLPDLRLCGSAALSSALIYRLKVESLFFFDKLKIKRQSIDRTDTPYILDMPYRYELTTTNLDELVTTLENILDEILTSDVAKPKASFSEIEPEIIVDTFSTQIQNTLKELKREIRKILKENEKILFSEYVKNMNTLETVRTLLLLLFIANDGLIKMIQDDEEIWIVGAIQNSSK